MKKCFVCLILIFIIRLQGLSQSNPVIHFFPPGTILRENIPYNNDTLHKHLMDIYLPANTKGKIPLVLFVHGGAWLSNDKYADMGYMKKTVSEIVAGGFALASIDYRFSTQAVFPAQIQDCYRAMAFLFDNADKYGLDKDRFAVMGFSAGGHLATLMGLAANNNVPAFYMPGSERAFNVKAVVDFYGPTDFLLFPGGEDLHTPEALLLGATPVARPDLAKTANPITYIDKNDPPCLIIHGEKDDMVSPKHSKVLSGWLGVTGVPNELIIVKDAPHFGPVFDSDEVRGKVMGFLKTHLK